MRGGSSPPKGGQAAQALGWSRGGFSTKIHESVDGLGNPLRFILTGGQQHDVTQAEEIPVVDLDEFIRANNPHNQHIVIIGGTAEPGTYKVIPWDEVDRSTPDGVGWWEIKADEKNASKGHRGYDGVVLKPPGSWFLPPHPVFVKELDLRRQT